MQTPWAHKLSLWQASWFHLNQCPRAKPWSPDKESELYHAPEEIYCCEGINAQYIEFTDIQLFMFVKRNLWQAQLVTFKFRRRCWVWHECSGTVYHYVGAVVFASLNFTNGVSPESIWNCSKETENGNSSWNRKITHPWRNKFINVLENVWTQSKSFLRKTMFYFQYN